MSHEKPSIAYVDAELHDRGLTRPERGQDALGARAVVLVPSPSLGNARGGIRSSIARGLRRLLSFAGPGMLVAVGYIDPGNWATDLVAGSRYSFALLSVVLVSSLMAMLLQVLCVRLGIASGRDLAQACRDAYPRAALPLWILAEIAITATDLAEVLGSAIALELLFGLPLPAGVVLTGADVLLLLGLERRGMRGLELGVGALVLIVAACFAFELVLSRPDLGAVLAGYAPRAAILHDRGMLYVAVGILGATVMPHNLYLHSSLVRTPAAERDRRSAVQHATLDTIVALGGAMFVNSAILVLAATVFHRAGRVDVADICDAHRLLSPLLGSTLASVAFAVALLAAGQSATITGTLAGQVVMSGFLDVRLKPWARRLVTRSLAIVPALVVACVGGQRGAASLLVGSQVILSLQLPFAIVPLLRLSADRRRMGALAAPRWMTVLGWATAIVVIALNTYLVGSLLRGGG